MSNTTKLEFENRKYYIEDKIYLLVISIYFALNDIGFNIKNITLSDEDFINAIEFTNSIITVVIDFNSLTIFKNKTVLIVFNNFVDNIFFTNLIKSDIINLILSIVKKSIS